MPSWWPFGRTEERASYTEEHINAALAAALGSSADVSRTAAAAAAALIWSRCLAAAVVEPAGLRATVTPQWLAGVGVDAVIRGEHLSVIAVEDRMVLRRSSSWDVTGGFDWRYRADLPTPSGVVTVSYPADGVVWIPWQASRQEPWRGTSPLVLAGLTGDALARAEQALAWELGTTTGYVLPLPVDGEDETIADFKAGLKTLKGGLSVAETTAGGWGAGKQAAPPGDLGAATRLGARPPKEIVDLRSDLAFDVLAACGIPPGMLDRDADGTARRAALAAFIDTALEPFARILAAELSVKLDKAVTLDLSGLARADTVLTRARAAAQLVGVGVAIEDALTASGLTRGGLDDADTESRGYERLGRRDNGAAANIRHDLHHPGPGRARVPRGDR